MGRLLRVALALFTISLFVPLGAAEQAVFVTVPVGQNPLGPVYDAKDGYVYVANLESNTMSVISGSTVVATIKNVTIPNASDQVVVSRGDVYVTVSTGVLVISGSSVVANLTVSPGSCGLLGVDNSTGVVFDADGCGNDMAMIQGVSVVQNDINVTMPYLNRQYSDLSTPVFNPENGKMYISDELQNATEVTSGGGPATPVPVGVDPGIPGVDPSNGYVYVPNTDSLSTACESDASMCVYSVSIISGVSVIATIPMNGVPGTPVFDQADGYVYVPEGCAHSNSYCYLFVISGTDHIATLSVPSVSDTSGSPLLYDPISGYVYANQGNHIEWVLGLDAVGNFTWTLEPEYQGLSDASYTPALNPVTGDIYMSATYNYVDVFSPAQFALSNKTTTVSSASGTKTLTSSSASSTSSGGIPEFPYQVGLASVVTLLIVASYVLVRRSPVLGRRGGAGAARPSAPT